MISSLISIKIPNPDGSGSTEILAPSGVPTGGEDMLSKLIGLGVWILFIGAILIAFFMLIWGGIQIITSEGDKASLEAGRNRLFFSIIGLAIVFLSLFIVQFVGHFFNVQLFSMP